jgi:hypothetical protein
VVAGKLEQTILRPGRPDVAMANSNYIMAPWPGLQLIIRQERFCLYI